MAMPELNSDAIDKVPDARANLARRMVMEMGRQARAKPPYARAPHKSGGSAHGCARRTLYKADRSADKGRNRHEMPG